jgi:hypothetical protein
MAYQTGTATGIDDLLDKLNTFAVSAGWTLDRREATTLSLHKNSVWINLANVSNEIRMSAALAFSAGSAWNAQSGASQNTQRCTQLTGSFSAYHFFADADYIHVAIEVDPGMYRHFGFGELAKTSNYIGGQYSVATMCDSTWRTALFSASESFTFSDAGRFATGSCYLDVDGEARWDHFNNQTTTGQRQLLSSEAAAGGSSILYSDWVNYCTPNVLNGLTALVPIQVFSLRASSIRSPLGYVKDLRWVNMVDIAPGQLLTIGSSEWLVFPSLQKTTGSPTSGNLGYAYKKVP